MGKFRIALGGGDSCRVMRGVVAACAAAILTLAPVAARAQDGYELYPTPQAIEYGSGTVELSSSVDAVFESGVDEVTKARLDEALDEQGVTVDEIDAPSSTPDRTEVLVGIKGSGEAVDQLAGAEAGDELFQNTDAYWLTVRPGSQDAPARIVVLGRDADSAYYGLTTLYQIMQQVSDKRVSALTISDYADVATRGFIEGYYGNPWSTADRVELMRWGGYYKQNAYIYAPKDDPKHNAQWRELYTDDELESIIKPLAEAGNASKCRFVYALHPFMNNAISFGSSYESDLAALKAKYLQVIDAGCRQIMVSADDAANPGSSNYIRLLTDLTDWLHGLQAMKNADGTPTYEGLKDIVPFVAANYAQAGENWYSQLPDNIRPIMTGTRVWGKADRSTITSFTNKSGVAPFMWINWPCTDNTRDHLSMGGYENALGDDVVPGSLVGCVINPMQQSEPSKVGIFLNADFSWNNWTSYDHADQVWRDAFAHVDHGSAQETDASNALRDLSEHMKWYQGGGVTFESRESEAVKPMLDAFRAKVADGSVASGDLAEIEQFFTDLRNATRLYADQAGNDAMREQIDPWIGFWTDGCDAALRYLKATRAHLDGDDDTLIVEYTQAKEAFDNALLHSFPYVADTQYARAGTRAVWPVVEALGDYLKPIVSEATGTVDVTATVALSGLGTSGNPANIVDGDPSTYAHFSGSNPTTNVNVGDSFTISYEPYQRASSVTFTQSVPASRPQDVLKDALVEYTTDGSTWVELGHVNGDAEQTLALPKTLDLKGLRFTNKVYYNGYWQVNEVACSAESAEKPNYGFASIEAEAGEVASIADGDTTTGARFSVPSEGMNAGLRFPKTTEVGRISITQGDQARAGVVEVLVKGAWAEVAAFEATAEQVVSLDANTAVDGVRLRVEGVGAWTLNEIAAMRLPSKVTPQMDPGMAAYQSWTLDKISDGNTGSYAHLKNTEANNIREGDWVGLALEPAARIGKITFVQDASGGDIIQKGKVEYQAEDGSWHKVGDVTSEKTQVFEFANVNAQAVRVTNLENTAKWWKVYELTAEEGYESPAGAIVSDLEDVSLSSTADSTSAAISGGAVELPAGSYVAIDLASIKANVQVDAAFVAAAREAGLTLVSSTNGLSWDAFEGTVSAARYVGIQNRGAAAVVFDFTAAPLNVAFPGTSGEFVFDGTSVEGHGTEAMVDGKLTTYWRPQDESGTLVYHVSDPLSGGLPRDGVRILSWGEPSGAKVSATVYTKADYSETTEVDLGVLDTPIADLALSKVGTHYHGIKSIQVTWSDGAVPSVAELAMREATFAPTPAPDPEPVYHTVTFDDCLKETENVAVEVADGQTVAPPTDPVCAGFTFEGWYLVDANGTYTEKFDFSTPITEDMTLWAKWSRDQVDPDPDPDPDPGNPEKPGSGNQGSGGQDPDGSLPSTGDSSLAVAMGLVGCAGAALALGVLRRRGQA